MLAAFMHAGLSLLVIWSWIFSAARWQWHFCDPLFSSKCLLKVRKIRLYHSGSAGWAGGFPEYTHWSPKRWAKDEFHHIV